MMSTSPVRCSLAIGLLLLSLGMSGCSSSVPGVKLKGKVILPTNFKLEKADVLTVNFFPADLAVTGVGGSADVDKESLTFSIEGKDKAGIPPGSYKVSVSCRPYPMTPELDKHKNECDRAFNVFNAVGTKLLCEVGKEPAQTVTLDLAKKTVTK